MNPAIYPLIYPAGKKYSHTKHIKSSDAKLFSYNEPVAQERRPVPVATGEKSGE